MRVWVGESVVVEGVVVPPPVREFRRRIESRHRNPTPPTTRLSSHAANSLSATLLQHTQQNVERVGEGEGERGRGRERYICTIIVRVTTRG